MTDSHENGLISARVLDGQGGCRALDWDGVRAWSSEIGARRPLWVHLDRREEGAQEWLRNESGLDAVVCDALLDEETRPRTRVFAEGALVILRGVNLNPGAEPDDMISVRVWVDAQRMISLRFPRLAAVQDLRDELDAGNGPTTSGQLLVVLAWHLHERMWPVLSNLDDIIDQLEDQVVEQPGRELRRQLGQIRRQAIGLRRYIAPQRDAISQLAGSAVSWLTDRDRTRLREIHDRTRRYVEDLDTLRERAAVVQEELAARMAEQMNRTMYVLSIVAGIFLPLGLLTGLLGINVGGMPGANDDSAFWVVCGLLVVLAGFGVWLFRRLRLF